MGIPLSIIDAFTDKPYQGNPAAVCMLDQGSQPDESWMQRVAAEMNLSETAFIRPLEQDYELRWFTPKAEVDLCGHATLAAAHAMWESGTLTSDAEARFHTRSGLLTVARRTVGWMEMNFPALPPTPVRASHALMQALRLDVLQYAGGNGMDLLVEVDSEDTLLAMEPDMAQLGQLPARGVIATCRSDSPAFDFKSRAFFPAVGVNEDPVTGSAHCALGPYWAAKLGKTKMTAYQASARGGSLRLRIEGDRVALLGQAVTVVRGELLE